MTQAASDDTRLKSALAMALVRQPRATLVELAKDVGISKTTLYRFCRTREELISSLIDHGAALLHNAIDAADLTSGPPREALRRFISELLKQRAFVAFVNAYWVPTEEPSVEMAGWSEFLVKSDAFFLRGQREGVFRVDISAAALSEAMSGLLRAFVDAEVYGRVAPASTAFVLESLFLDGASSR
ncbi:MAG: TetR/AcrR family transcriptional regulator [Gammaproteobacteria bacterium]|nr:MAG: TetR/AcrR family transcriptional regulator [Gammaproteobacteria bacterium]